MQGTLRIIAGIIITMIGVGSMDTVSVATSVIISLTGIAVMWWGTMAANKNIW